MHKPIPQIPLDFDGEEKDPSPSPDANGSTSQLDGQYLASAGVGVRVKAYKQSALPDGNGDLFQATPTAAEPITLTQATAAAASPIAELAPTAISIIKPAIIEPAPTAAGPAVKAAVKTGPSKRGRKSLKQVTAEADLIKVPADEVLFSKQYYTMGEVSEMFKVNQSLLRYWETEFDILQPRKNKKGDRYFRPVDIKNLHLIYHLLRQKKYTIEGAKEFLRNNKKAKERFEVIERLQQIRNFLLEWKAQL